MRSTLVKGWAGCLAMGCAVVYTGAVAVLMLSPGGCGNNNIIIHDCPEDAGAHDGGAGGAGGADEPGCAR